jgi:hypothetical protein
MGTGVLDIWPYFTDSDIFLKKKLYTEFFNIFLYFKKF